MCGKGNQTIYRECAEALKKQGLRTNREMREALKKHGCVQLDSKKELALK